MLRQFIVAYAVAVVANLVGYFVLGFIVGIVRGY